MGGLRALAHPLRLQLLDLLRMDGPATATKLAARVGETSGNVSWHLRQLAASGFIEEDSERGNRRERWWRACHRYTSVRDADFQSDPEARQSLVELKSHTLSQQMQRAEEFLYDDWGDAWRDAAGIGHWVLRLTPDELLELGREVTAVLERYEALSRGSRDEETEDVIFQVQAFPRHREDDR
ncbi:ArsR family transcriptional regulator [Saccharomonospora azurea SZMC 14600]|nr:ArsR family transcriptional regulator [Saccharomonospora azurea SZMC 14600]